VLASRLYNYFPERVSAGVFLAVPYIEPGSFNLDEVNSQSKQFLGYELYGYWHFLTEPGAHDLIAEHVSSAISLMSKKPVLNMLSGILSSRSSFLPRLNCGRPTLRQSVNLKNGYSPTERAHAPSIFLKKLVLLNT
jgi:hypothetical protein